jgi:hypothetical protein
MGQFSVCKDPICTSGTCGLLMLKVQHNGSMQQRNWRNDKCRMTLDRFVFLFSLWCQGIRPLAAPSLFFGIEYDNLPRSSGSHGDLPELLAAIDYWADFDASICAWGTNCQFDTSHRYSFRKQHGEVLIFESRSTRQPCHNSQRATRISASRSFIFAS